MTKEKIQNKLARGFTLLELLVVVIIIGILAAIALPQYKIAVETSRLATVKNGAHTLARALQHYYLINNQAPQSLNDLDVEISNNPCYLSYSTSSFRQIKCKTDKIEYVLDVYYLSPQIYRRCFALSLNLSDTANKVCQKETKRTTPNNCDNQNKFCHYLYQ